MKAANSILVTVSGMVTRTRDSTLFESLCLDGGNGQMKDDFRDIFRGTFVTETIIGADIGREVWNDLRWQVSTEHEIIIPTFIFINPPDCEDPSFHRESEFIPPFAAHDPWVGYHIVMFKYHIYTVAPDQSNVYNKHRY